MATLAEILRRYWPEYERQWGSAILPSHRRAVQAILNCRTAALGGELYRCAPCQVDHYVYHSCNHRACPQCGHAQASEWIARQQLKLLPVPYYLITFTVPEGLRPWLRSHQKRGYGLLLQESAATLQDVAGREKYLGAELGILSILHTSGRQLQFHPHVHCVVPAGGLRADGLRWCAPKSPNYFLPQKVLAARFRHRLKGALAEVEDSLSIPPEVWRQSWVVDVQPAGTGEPALQYLSTYLYRPPLAAPRKLQEQDGQVSFLYKDHEDKQWHRLKLPVLEFIRRFLEQVLPQGFHRVRFYGWLSPAAQAKWQRILSLLDYEPPALVLAPPPSAPTCPCCGSPLVWAGTLSRAPPGSP